MLMSLFGGMSALVFAVQLFAFRRARQVWLKFLPAAATGVGLLLFLAAPGVIAAALPGGAFTALYALAFGAGLLGCLLGLLAAVLTRRI